MSARAPTLFVVSILFLYVDWVSSRRQKESDHYGLDDPADVSFDLQSRDFAENTMFPEAGPFSIPREPSNRLPSFATRDSNRRQYGGRPSRRWEHERQKQSENMMMDDPEFLNTRGRKSPVRSSPSRYGGGGFTRRPVLSSFPDPLLYPIDRNLRGIDDFGPELYRRSRRIGGRGDMYSEAGQIGDTGLEMSSYGGGRNYRNALPMLELPGYDNMLMADSAILQNRDRRTDGIVDDLGDGYYENMAQPAYEGSNTYAYADPTSYSYGGERRSEKKYHHSRNSNKYQDEEVYSGDGKSYGPYGYQDPDLDESLIEELELLDQQPDQASMSTQDAADSAAAGYSATGNNEMQLEEMANNFPSSSVPDSASHGSGRMNERTTKKPRVPTSLDALEEEVLFGNMRREAGETPQDIIEQVKNPTLPKDASGTSPNQNRERSRGGSGGRTHNYNQFERSRGAEQQKLPGGMKRVRGSEEDETLIRQSFPMPGEMAGGRNFYQGDGLMEQSDGLGGMYGMTELNRRRRNVVPSDYYDNGKAYPILRPLPVPISPSYTYDGQPLYTYELPNLVFNRRKRQGNPVQLLINRRRRTGEPRRVIRRIIRRRPLMRRDRRLRQQIRNQNEASGEEDFNENLIEVDEVTQATIPKIDVPVTNVNTTADLVTTSSTTTATTTTTSQPTETTEMPRDKVANPKSDAAEVKPVKSDRKRKRETGPKNIKI